MTAILSDQPSFGDQLRSWRTQRRMSQLDLSGAAEVSSRHLSFLETGRSNPSREMVIHLAEVLDIPLESRNTMLMAAGHAPTYRERSLQDEDMAVVRTIVSTVLAGHMPNPAIVVDKHWDLIDANGGASIFLAGVDPALLEPPVNVYRLSLHPDGLGANVVNFAEYAAHLLWRLRRQVERTADTALADLLAEVQGYVPNVEPHHSPTATPHVLLPMTVDWEGDRLEFVSTIAVFGAPLDVTVDDLAIETFYPADTQTADVLRSLVEA